jgi:hypothetical protein
MQNFKKILNILATEKSKAAANDSCCEAADRLNLDNFKNFINSINNKSQEQKRIETRDYLIWTISDVIIKYCDCENSPNINAASIACKKEIEDYLKDGSYSKNPLLSAQDIKLEIVYRIIQYKTFRIFKTTAENIALRDYNYQITNTNNIDFLKDFCEWRRLAAPSLLRDVRQDMFNAPFPMQEVDALFELMIMADQNQEAVMPDCPPSPNDPSIVSLATKVGAPVAVVSTAVWLFLRSRAKKCTAVTTAALGLTAAIMTQFEGSASGSDQLDEEEINRVTNDIIEKECAGVLPRSCQEGGSQPPSGETEPPSGGGGGVTGGDGLL